MAARTGFLTKTSPSFALERVVHFQVLERIGEFLVDQVFLAWM
jgi:hypothetical protein